MGRGGVQHWEQGYGKVIDAINALEPEMVTIGALRATSEKSLRTAARANGRDESIFDFLSEEKDPSGFKYRIPFAQQVEMFRFAVQRLRPETVPALCKEDRAVWDAVGLQFRGCHCLLGEDDAIVDQMGTPGIIPLDSLAAA